MILSKEEFLSCITLIEKKRKQENKLTDTLSELSPDTNCDLLLFAEYEDKLISILQTVLNDTSELISYKIYEFDQFDEETKLEQIIETPEVRTWETVYDYLTDKLEA